MALFYTVISRVMDDDNKKLLGFLLASPVSSTQFVDLDSLGNASSDVEYTNAKYDPDYKTLVGIKGNTLVDYPSITRFGVRITPRLAFVVQTIIVDAENPRKPIGVIAYNNVGTRYAFTLNRFKRIVSNCDCSNFTLKPYGDTFIPIQKDGSMFPSVPFGVSVHFDGNSVLKQDKENRLPVVQVYAVDDYISNKALNISSDSRLIEAKGNLRKLTPYYYIIFQTLALIPAPIGTFGVTEDRMYYDMLFASNHTVPKLTFILIHEMMHIAMQHSLRFKNRRSHSMWNIACDLFINSTICFEFGCEPGKGVKTIDCGLGSKNPQIECPEYGVFMETLDEACDLIKDTPETIYNRLMVENQGKSNNDSSSGNQSLDQQLADTLKKQAVQSALDQLEKEMSKAKAQVDQTGSADDKALASEAQQEVKQGSSDVKNGMANNNANQLQQGVQTIQQGVEDMKEALNNSQGNEQGQENGSQGNEQGQQNGSQDSQSGSQGQQGQQSGSQGSQSGSQGQQSGQQSGSQGSQSGSGSQGQQGDSQGSSQSGSGSQGSPLDNALNQLENLLNNSSGQQGGSQGSSQSGSQGNNQSGSQGSQQGTGQQGQQGQSSSQDSLNGGVDTSGLSDLTAENVNNDGNFRKAKVIYRGKVIEGDYIPDIASNRDTSSNPNHREQNEADSKRKLADMQMAIDQEKVKNGGKMPDLVRGKGWGKGCYTVPRHIKIGLESSLDWKQLLRNMLNGKPSRTFSVARPNGRYASMGTTVASRMPAGKPKSLSGVKFAVDVSGSVSTHQIQVMLSEIAAIFKYYNMEGELIYWTSKICNIGNFKSLGDMLKIDSNFSGGTDVKCVFDYISGRASFAGNRVREKFKDIPGVFILTDGQFSTNYAEYARIFDSKVVWLITGDHANIYDFKPPFGKIIGLELENR